MPGMNCNKPMSLEEASNCLEERGMYNFRAYLIIYRTFNVLKTIATELNIDYPCWISKKQLAHEICLLLQKRLNEKELLVKNEGQVHEMIGGDSIRSVQDLRNSSNHVGSIGDRGS